MLSLTKSVVVQSELPFYVYTCSSYHNGGNNSDGYTASSVGKSSCSEGINSSPSCVGSLVNEKSALLQQSANRVSPKRARNPAKSEGLLPRFFPEGTPPGAVASRPPGGALAGRARSWRGGHVRRGVVPARGGRGLGARKVT